MIGSFHLPLPFWALILKMLSVNRVLGPWKKLNLSGFNFSTTLRFFSELKAATQTEGIKLKSLIELEVNGQNYELAVDTHRTLLEVLREQLGFTGTKNGCDQGECGTCTILLDGVPVHSCLTLALNAQGKKITTIEGLARGEELHALQQAFVDHGAIQCGFCTPGMILTGKALLEKNPSPTDEEIRRAISGNLCRCTGYVKIVEAIKAAADMGRGKN